MELTPCLGIGDFLILKMICLSEKLELKKCNISLRLIRIYRQYPDRFQEFITYFIKQLFPKTEIKLTEGGHTEFPFAKYSIKTPYIYDHIQSLHISKPYIVGTTGYIVFHTKVRMECQMDQFNKRDLPLLHEFLKTFKTTRKILIMGERVIEHCLEQKNLGITSLYEEYKMLSNNNTVIDLTKEVLFSGNPDYDDFINELNIIHHADLNIIIGIGGPLNICYAMCPRNLAYIGVVRTCLWVKDNYPETYQDMTQFLERLSKI